MRNLDDRSAIRWFRDFNWTVFVCAVLLVAVGVTFIWSSSYTTPDDNILEVSRVKRQLTHAAVALAVFLTLLTVDYRKIGGASFFLYLLSVALLLVVLVMGRHVKGASRWVAMGSTQLQPSELAKVALILVLASYLMRGKGARTFLGFVVPFLMAAPLLGLILVEPNLGTVLILIPVPFAMLFVAGARLRYLLPILIVGILFLPAVYFFCTIESPKLQAYQQKLLKPHQKARVFAFINPSADEAGSAYQLIQSLIAIGSGGIFGKGLGNGSQNRLEFLPERHTDFIFSVIGEEWGFCGAAMVLILYLVLLLSALSIADRTREPFGRLVVVGSVTLLTTQVFINVGMTMRMCPITGLPLPFISYGGSSLVSSFVLLSLIVNVDMRRPTILAPEDFT